MSWNQITVDWSDSEVVPAIRYPSLWISSDILVDYVFASIESVNPGREFPGEIIDSLNNHNMGNIEQPARFTLELACFPHGKAFDLLHKCAMGRRYFDVVLAPADSFDANLLPNGNIGQPQNAWNPVKEVYKAVKVRRISERYSIGTKPLVTFTCTALRFVFNQIPSEAGIEIGNGVSDFTNTDAALRMVHNSTPIPEDPGNEDPSQGNP